MDNVKPTSVSVSYGLRILSMAMDTSGSFDGDGDGFDGDGKVAEQFAGKNGIRHRYTSRRCASWEA